VTHSSLERVPVRERALFPIGKDPIDDCSLPLRDDPWAFRPDRDHLGL